MVDVHIKYLEHFAQLPGAVAVDVGCRTADLVRQLAKRKAKPIGIHDGAEAPGKAGRNIRFEKGTADNLPLANGSADLLVYISSFHHIPLDRQRAALQEAWRVLRTDGRLHVVEPFSEGSYFEVLKLMDDQTDIRSKSLDNIATAWSLGLKPVIAGSYIQVERFDNFDDFRHRVIDSVADRAKAFALNERQVREAFAHHGVIEDDGRILFRQPCRMYHFTRQALSDSAA